MANKVRLGSFLIHPIPAMRFVVSPTSLRLSPDACEGGNLARDILSSRFFSAAMMLTPVLLQGLRGLHKNRPVCVVLEDSGGVLRMAVVRELGSRLSAGGPGDLPLRRRWAKAGLRSEWFGVDP